VDATLRLSVSSSLPLFLQSIRVHLPFYLWLTFLITGCNDVPQPRVVAASQPSAPTAIQSDPPPVYASHAAPVPAVIYVGLYQFAVPLGTVSGDADFWANVAPALDSSANELLDKNGVRAGLAAVDDWGKFKSILDKAGAGQPGNSLPQEFIGTSVNNEEFARSAEMPSQELFYYDSHGLSGTVYDQCMNYFALSFGPSPAKDGSVRLELCPAVRADRRQLVYTVLNDRDEIDYKTDEHIYDLNLRIDLPPGKCLIVAPSEQSRRSLSIGHQFLTLDTPAGRREIILVFVVHQPPAIRAAFRNSP
jgi:hypothetical protein